MKPVNRYSALAAVITAALVFFVVHFVTDNAARDVPFTPPPPPAPTQVQTETPPPPTATAALAPETPEPTPEPISVTVAVGGDVLPDGRIGAQIQAGTYENILDPALAERMRAADVTMVNLETSVSVRGAPIPEKAYTFRSPPDNLSLLTDWLGTDVVSLANTHTFDYGWDAFFDTLEKTDAYGLAHIGAGNNIAEAAEPYIAEVDGVWIAFFAANQIMTYTNWRSGENSPGQLIVREPGEIEYICAAVAEAKRTCDYAVVYMHWGIELDKTPSQRQTSVARALIDAGADVVIGAHPHVVQTFELYNGKPILYSVGNFLFNSLNPDTMVVFLHIDDEGLRVETVPCVIRGTLTAPADADDRARLFENWRNISPGCDFTERGFLRDAAA
ncbi:MAG: CapA family protein [Oscillospiraceae bacterium]|jgi:poly-gamma-glutamate synthesis protein (capsule biosynthesis protein)|nr:CapA family protein [Oscillospiraceae bacterium]